MNLASIELIRNAQYHQPPQNTQLEIGMFQVLILGFVFVVDLLFWTVVLGLEITLIENYNWVLDVPSQKTLFSIHFRSDSDSLNVTKCPSLTGELLALASCGWYWGPISREKAEERLEGEPEGTFLVRDSSADCYLLTLSFRSDGNTFHARIMYDSGLFGFYVGSGYPTVKELIDSLMDSCYLAYPVHLTKPLSRFMQVRSLQYLCRFVIRQVTRVDNIRKLPLPEILKGYIEEGYY